MMFRRSMCVYVSLLCVSLMAICNGCGIAVPAAALPDVNSTDQSDDDSSPDDASPDDSSSEDDGSDDAPADDAQSKVELTEAESRAITDAMDAVSGMGDLLAAMEPVFTLDELIAGLRVPPSCPAIEWGPGFEIIAVEFDYADGCTTSQGLISGVVSGLYFPYAPGFSLDAVDADLGRGLFDGTLAGTLVPEADGSFTVRGTVQILLDDGLSVQGEITATWSAAAQSLQLSSESLSVAAGSDQRNLLLSDVILRLDDVESRRPYQGSTDIRFSENADEADPPEMTLGFDDETATSGAVSVSLSDGREGTHTP